VYPEQAPGGCFSEASNAAHGSLSPAANVPPPAFGHEPVSSPICHEYTNTGACSRISGGQSCRYRHLTADHPDVLADKIRRGKAPPGIGIGVAASAGMMMGGMVRPCALENTIHYPPSSLKRLQQSPRPARRLQQPPNRVLFLASLGVGMARRLMYARR
jgi:hypothetical protein